MDPRTSTDYLDFLSDRLDKCISAFEEFMTHHVENVGPGSFTRGLAPAVFSREGADEERVRALTAELNRLAGSLMDLSSVTGVRMMVEGAGVIDPFVN
ncbi:hypothetical protein [Clavibacter zhangzhiyongii]|uniref:hypothetical protein n=1 Tax=Clavibacter zhangzhiyongii TaxID=2768071 RepID=UPI00195BF7DA|nr:hypothetical protein [Clavibacter zhangzhiyongii]MBM7024991.1 hypothetical protein [Clavibacter zhangzhiyongii]